MPRDRRPAGPPRLLLAVLVLGLALATLAGLAPSARPWLSAASALPPTPGPSLNPAAPPRIPLVAAATPHDQVTAAGPLVDPGCSQGCIARVADGGVGSGAVLWQRDSVAYVAATSETFASLRDPVVTWSGLETLSLYVLSHVRPEQDALLGQYGTVRDRAGDLRLLEASHVPLQVDQIYAAGIWVEKLQPDPFVGPGSVARSIPETIAEFSAINSRDGVLGDREFDDPGTILAAEYLFRRYRQLGFEVRYVDFTGPSGRHQVNVVADPPHGRVEPATLITGHYDSISPPGAPAPGADDNGSGIAAMLELAARVAKQGFSPPVSFVAFGAEEPGLYGSDDYVRRLASAGVKLKAVINLDAIGIPNNGNTVTIDGDDNSRWIYRDLVALSGDRFWLEWLASNRYLSDDEHFRRAGYPAILVTSHIWGTEPLHHTPNDTIGHVDMNQVAGLTDLIWRWLQA